MELVNHCPTPSPIERASRLLGKKVLVKSSMGHAMFLGRVAEIKLAAAAPGRPVNITVMVESVLGRSSEMGFFFEDNTFEEIE